MQRRLAAIFAADIVGYSAMMGANEAAALEALRLLREELFEPEVARRGGEVVKRMGDGWLVEFASVVDAVDCAVAVQEAVAARDFALRIGVHLGDIVHAEGDIYGDGVNIAARLEARGAPGHVLISDDARRQIAGKTGAEFHDNGPVALKNIAEPMRVWSWPAPLPGLAAGSDEKPGVHVALFDARGPDAEDLAESLRDDLATGFSRQTSVRLVGLEEKADFVVGGAVRASGGRWRINAHLTERESGQRIWSDRREETGEDVFAIQDRSALWIAGSVRGRVALHLAAKAAGRPPEELSVEELLNLAARGYQTRTRDKWEESKSLSDLALARDPDNWMAMAMSATAIFATEYIFGWRGLSTEAAEEAHGMLKRALWLKGDSDFARAMHAGFLLNQARDHRAARIEAEHALQLSQAYGQALSFLAEIEAFSGETDCARALALRSVDLDPTAPMYHALARAAGRVFAVIGEHETAADWFQRADSANADHPGVLIGLTASRWMSGDEDGARAAMATLLEAAPDFNLAEMQTWPFRDPEDWAPFHAALLAAGAPETPMRDRIRLAMLSGDRAGRATRSAGTARMVGVRSLPFVGGGRRPSLGVRGEPENVAGFLHPAKRLFCSIRCHAPSRGEGRAPPGVPPRRKVRDAVRSARVTRRRH
jgi:adenylate cyclase